MGQNYTGRSPSELWSLSGMMFTLEIKVRPSDLSGTRALAPGDTIIPDHREVTITMFGIPASGDR